MITDEQLSAIEVPRCICGSPRCAIGDALADLAMLWRNLAIAGALCAAFARGMDYGYDTTTDEPWHPGCGRSA